MARVNGAESQYAIGDLLGVGRCEEDGNDFSRYLVLPS
jgi:hypothetical protein